MKPLPEESGVGQLAGQPTPKYIEPNKPRVSDNKSASRENFLSVPASQTALVRSLPRLYSSNKPPVAYFGSPAPTKALLANVGGTYLFRIREADLTYFTIERGDRTWEFQLLENAEKKFLSVANRGGAK